MSLDKKISEAIKESVAASGQSPALARRLIAWMEAVASGNEDLGDKTAADRHLEVLYAETSLNGLTGESS